MYSHHAPGYHRSHVSLQWVACRDYVRGRRCVRRRAVSMIVVVINSAGHVDTVHATEPQDVVVVEFSEDEGTDSYMVHCQNTGRMCIPLPFLVEEALGKRPYGVSE